MTAQTFSLLVIAILTAILLWILYENIRDWRLFGHRSEHDFSMNLSTLQAMGIFEHTPGLIAIDVRPASQFEVRHLPGALNAPYENGNLDQTRIEKVDRSTPILVYCDGGHRSRKALKAISDAGFHSIYHINRGFMMWRLFGGPYEGKSAKNES